MPKELIVTMVIKKEQGRYSSWCPELDVASQGHTIEEARLNLKEAVGLHVDTMVENGDLKELLEKIGLTSEDFNKEVLLSETFSGPLEIPLAV